LASQILGMKVRDSGLCVIIGCGSEGNPALAADLASTGKMLVHGIALDDAALERARRAVSSAGVDGVATIEKLPIKPLPYRDTLANVVIVEDFKAASMAGFSRRDALRVLAPFGSLCVRKNGKWDIFRKPLPREMDEWTHGSHGADGNLVSNDKVVRFPVGFRWHAGLPMNIRNPKRTANAWSSTRGLAVASGRCFSLSTTVLENLGPTSYSDHGLEQYVTARDAFNGLFLWRKRIGATYYGGLFYANRAPFVAVGDGVYVAMGDGKLVALSVSTGEVMRTFDTTYAPGRLLVDRQVVAVATWKEGTKVGGIHGVDRRRMDFSVAEGTVEAFSARTGARLWLLEELATSIVSKDGILFMVVRTGADKFEEMNQRRRRGEKPLTRPQQVVVAVDLKTGKRLWAVTSQELGSGDEYLRLDAAGLGIVTIAHNNGARTSALSAKNGRRVLQAKTGSYAAFYDGALHLAGQKYDSSTGKASEASSIRLGATICTPNYFVNNIIVANRGGGFLVNGKRVLYGGARGGCLFASVPAYGAFYTPQNWCACAPAQIPGFIVFGPIDHEPTAKEMEVSPPVEKGPAYSELNSTKSVNDAEVPEETGSQEWPMYRLDALRSNATGSAAPQQLDVLWEKAVAAKAPSGLVGTSWREYLNSPVTAPVIAEGIVVMAAMDRNQVIALDAGSGEELWREAVGGRVDTPPTIHQGLCLFGSHDGYVNALSSKDGRLAWRMRAAPREERMVSYGKVESPWPVIGTVLVADGIAYASAGRTQGSDGGLVVRAFDPATGEIVWSNALAPTQDGGSYRQMRRNDLLVRIDDTVQLMVSRMDSKTGESRPNLTLEYAKKLAQIRQKRELKRRQEAAKAAEKAAEEAKAALLAQITEEAESEEAELGEEYELDEEDEFDEEDELDEEGELDEEDGAKKEDGKKEGEKKEDDPEGEDDEAFHEIAPGIGLEGFVSWHWTRLGNRKFGSMSFGNMSGCMFSCGQQIVIASINDGRGIRAFGREQVKTVVDALNPNDRKWELNLPGGYQTTAMVVCRGSVVVGGGVYGPGRGTGRGFVQVLSGEKGEKAAERMFPSPLTYNGLAVADGKVYATFADGSAVCLGEKPPPE